MLSKHALLESELPKSRGVWGNILLELCPATLLPLQEASGAALRGAGRRVCTLQAHDGMESPAVPHRLSVP